MYELSSVLDLKEDVPFGSGQARLVGQERDGTLLYTWSGQPSSSCSLEVSFIGMFDPLSQSSRIVLKHDKVVNIVNCSIDQSHTFLGFVTIEQTSVTGAQGKRETQDVYKAFLAEIRPQNRTFYLNLERQLYLKLQFLYGTANNPIPSPREVHLLVFLHKESIGLYHLPVKRDSETNAVLNGEPRKEQVVHKKFIWSQWDAQTQSLYVIYFRKHGKDSQGCTTYLPLLVGYQLTQAGTAEPLFEYILSLPLDQTSTRTNSQYLKEGPFHYIPDSSLVLQVLQTSSGGLCVCYQHTMSEGKKKTVIKENSQVLITYSILVLHHGKLINCRCSHLPFSVAQSARLYFCLIGDYVSVHLAGYFTQLLNVAVEFEPSNHISWRDPNWKMKSPEKCALNKDQNIVPGYIVPFIDHRHKESMSTCVYEPSTGIAYRLRISDKTICEIFKNNSDLTTRAAILHFSLLHAKDIVLTQRLFRAICEDTLNPDLPHLMEEMLVASTFGLLRTKCDMGTLQCLPFTCFPTMRGQVLTGGANKVRLLNISYSNVNISTFIDKRRSGSSHGSIWDLCVSNIKSVGHVSRFDCHSPKQVLDQEHLQEEKGNSNQDLSLLRRLEAAAKSAFSGHSYSSGVENNSSDDTRGPLVSPVTVSRPTMRASSRTDQILGTLPPFLSRSGADNQISDQQAIILNKTIRLLNSHLLKNLKKESRNKIRSVTEEYTRAQMYMTRLLCHLIWSVFGSDEAEFIPLDVSVSPQEAELFSILERFHRTTEALAFPQPPGLNFYFTTLAFRNLSLRDFLQYVDRGVVHLSAEFATQMLEDLDDSERNSEAKLQVISRLCKVEAIECLQQWDHPISKMFLGSKYTTCCITNDGPVGWEIFPTPPNLLTGDNRSMNGTDPRSLSSNLHPPVKTLIRLLENKDPGLPIGDCLGDFHLDSKYIEEAATLYTYSESKACRVQAGV